MISIGSVSNFRDVSIGSKMNKNLLFRCAKLSTLNEQDIRVLEIVEDDISQKFSLEYFGEDWTNSVFSKAFKKKNMDVINYLIDSPYIELVFSINNESDLTSKISL